MTPEEFTLLFCDRYPAWRRMVLRKNYDDDPDDIIQSALEGIVPVLHRVTSPGYIYQRIAWQARWRNRADGRAAHNFDKCWVPLFQQEDRDGALSHEPMQQVEHSLDCQAVMAAAHPKERRLLHDVYIDGYTYAECAVRLGTTEGYVKSRVSLIRARLRAVLAGTGPRHYTPPAASRARRKSGKLTECAHAE